MKPAGAALLLLLLAQPAAAEPLAVTVEPIPRFPRLTNDETFGPFTWRGGLTLTAPAEHFGGFSGLVLAPGCEDLLAASDSGRWLHGTLRYDHGRLAGFSGGEMAHILDGKGRPPYKKGWGDAEAVTPLADGRIAVAFESRVRVGLYDVGREGLGAKMEEVPHPRDLELGPRNGEVESLAQLPDGSLIAVTERQYDPRGRPKGWIWQGEDETAFTLRRYGEYDVTDLVALPDGSVLTLERRFTSSSLPGMAIRRFTPAGVRPGDTVEPELLFEAKAPLYVIDNMEGMALCERDGETRLTLISDDNFNGPLQSTILLQFAYRP